MSYHPDDTTRDSNLWGYWSQTLELLSLALSRRCSSVSLYVSSISACEKCSQWQPALFLLESFEGAGDVAAENAAISASAKAGQWQQALKILSKISGSRLQINLISMNASISACEKASMWEEALALYAELLSWSLQADGITCNALTSSFAEAAVWRLALHFFYEEDLSLDEVSYDAVLSACQRSARWEASISLLVDMRTTIMQSLIDTSVLRSWNPVVFALGQVWVGFWCIRVLKGTSVGLGSGEVSEDLWKEYVCPFGVMGVLHQQTFNRRQIFWLQLQVSHWDQVLDID